MSSLAAVPGADASVSRPRSSTRDLRVLVTGSSAALGFDIAAAFVARGASVVFHGRRPDFSPPLGTDDEATAYVCADLGDEGQADRLAAEATAAVERPINVLINNLGPWDGTPLSDISPAAWQRALASGLTAHLRLAQLLAPGMQSTGYGRIINVTAGSASRRNHGTYGFVKAALGLLTEGLAAELGPNITVNAVAPGQLEESVPLMNAINPVAVPAMLALTPLGRFARRAEVAELIVALTGPAYDAMTGASIPFDGGYHLPLDEGA